MNFLQKALYYWMNAQAIIFLTKVLSLLRYAGSAMCRMNYLKELILS